MQTRSWVAVIGLALVLTGCATRDGFQATMVDSTPRVDEPWRVARVVQCAERDLCINRMKVVGTGASATIEPEGETLQMVRGAKGTLIIWRLTDSAGYELRDDSISPHTSAAVPGKETTSQAEWDRQIRKIIATERLFVVRNANSMRGNLFYDITVYEKSSGRAIKLDPAIYNDP